MSEHDPYKRKLVNPGFYVQKCKVEAKVVAVLRGTLENRNLELIPQPSRAVKHGEIHEIIVTDEDASPGSRVGRIAYVAFLEFLNGGVLLSGDELLIGGKSIGKLAGFDMSHFSNHMNIVVRGELKSGEDRHLFVGALASFQMASPEDETGTGNSSGSASGNSSG